MKFSRQLALRLRAQRSARRRPLFLEALEVRACPATFFVNTNADTFDLVPGDGQARDVSGNTSLRAAIMEANALPGADTINVPSGNFVLTRGGIREDAALDGDLDITDNLTITGAGAGSTTIDGNQLDRIFHVHRGASVDDPRDFNLSGVLLTGGRAAGNQGADFQNHGGAIFIDFFTDATIQGVHFVGNQAPTAGTNTAFGVGGAIAASGVLTVENSRFEDNLATNSGGALYLAGNIGTGEQNRNLIRALVRDSSLVQNTSNGGGAITSHIPLTIERSLISGNTGRQGGGIEVQASIFSSLTLVNSTVTGNVGTFGGGIWYSNKVTVQASTIAHNRANNIGGGIHGFGVGPTLQNSLVANNTAPTGPDISGSITSLGDNLVRNPTGASGFVASDILNADPLLATLANNGGPTLTHALLAGSPAIDAANTAAGPSTDQRGVARPQGPASDIGAFERFGNQPPVAEDQSFSTDEDILLERQLVATDLENATLTFTRLTLPANGAVSVFPNGQFRYLPFPNFFGTDTFRIRVSDGSLTDEATVTITVNPVNDAPFVDNPTFTLAEDQTLSDNIDFLDVEGDPVTFSLLAGPPQGSITVNGDGTFVYTPTLNFIGLESFTFRARDDKGATRDGTVMIKVTPVNDAPVANDDRYFVDEDQTLTLTALPITRLVMHSEPGDWVGQGNDYDFTPPTSTFNAEQNFDNGVSISIDAAPPSLFWHLDFATADATPLAVAHYPNAQRFPFQDPGRPGLAVFGDGRAQNELVGEFTVRDVVYGNDDEVISFAATFVQQGLDQGGPPEPPLTGTIQFNTTIGARGGVLENDTDVDGDTLLSAILVAGPAHGSLSLNRDGTLSYTPNANFSGLDTFTYRTSDGQAESNVATVEIVVNPMPDAPVAVDDNATTAEDTAVTIDVLANDIDADGDRLSPILLVSPNFGGLVQNADNTFTYTPFANIHGTDTFTYQVTDGSGPTNVATVTVTIMPVNDAPLARSDSADTDEDTAVTINVVGNDFDADGDLPLSPVLATGPAHGSIVVNPNRTITYTPAANYHGPDSFTYRATDGTLEGNVATVSITVRPVNDPPVAVDDPATTNEDTAVTIAVIPNDGDVDGDALSPVLASGPAHGSVALNADGTFTYTPAANYHGPDSFAYRASDGTATSNIATVSITVNSVNDAPRATNDDAATDEDTAVTIAVLANDDDVDGDTLNPVLVTGPAHGTLVQNADGTFTYTPAADYHGSDSFTYRASDGAAQSNLATVSIAVRPVNDAPVARDDNASTSEDNHVIVVVLTNDSDIDGDALSPLIVVGPAHGSLQRNADGTFTFTPTPDFHGSDSFTYKVSDGQAESNTAVVNIVVESVNDAPVARDNFFDALEDTPLSVALPGVLDNDADIDGDVLAALLASGPSHGTLTLNPDGSLNYTPAANFHGTDSFTYRASDGTDASNLATVTIEVAAVNDAPVAVNNSYTATQDTPLVVSAPGILAGDSDADGDALSASLVSGPAHGTLALQANGSFTYTPAAGYSGPDSFSYRASDGAATSGVAVVSINVEPSQATLGKINANASMDNGLRDFFINVQGHEAKGGSIRYQGHFRFQDRQNGISLEATSIDHLRVELDGRRATFRGSATVNGVAGYTFVVTVMDFDHPGPGADNFRVQIVGPGGFAYDSLLFATRGGGLDDGNIHVRPR